MKVSVSLPDDVVTEVRERVGKRAFSRYIAEAVEQRLRLEKLGEIVEAYEAERGPLSEEIKREVEEEWRAAFAQ